jgi:hypothetical protein
MFYVAVVFTLPFLADSGDPWTVIANDNDDDR